MGGRTSDHQLAAALAVVTALRDTAPLGALVFLALGAAVFTLGHGPPMGPAGMGLSCSASLGPSSALVRHGAV